MILIFREISMLTTGRQHNGARSRLLRSYHRPDHLPQGHDHLSTTAHCATLRCWWLLHRPLPIPILAVRPSVYLLHHLRTPHDDRLHHVPRLHRRTNPLRCYLPHCRRRVLFRCVVQCPGIRQRCQRHGACECHWYQCHAGQRRRPDQHLELFAV